jgi:hypothetical protein
MKIILTPPDNVGSMKCYTDFNPIEHSDLIDAIVDAGIEIEETGFCKYGSYTGFIIFPVVDDLYDMSSIGLELERLGFKTEIA